MNFIRSAKAPEMSAGVMTANIIWNAAKASVGTVPWTSEANRAIPAYSSPPMSPWCVGPKVSEYP